MKVKPSRASWLPPFAHSTVTLRSPKEAASQVTPSYVQCVRLNYGGLAADT